MTRLDPSQGEGPSAEGICADDTKRRYPPGVWAYQPLALITSTLTPAAKFTWIAIASFAGGGHTTSRKRPTRDEILERMPPGTSPATVSHAIAELTKAGWLAVGREKQASGRNVYRLLDPCGAETTCAGDDTGGDDATIGSDSGQQATPFVAPTPPVIEGKSENTFPTPRGSNHQGPFDNESGEGNDEVDLALDEYARRCVPPDGVRNVDAWRRTVRQNAEDLRPRARQRLDEWYLTPVQVGQVLASDKAGEVSPLLQSAQRRVPFDALSLVEEVAS